MPNEGETERNRAEASKISTTDDRLVNRFLKMEHSLHTECPTPGLGMAVYCLGKALNRVGIPSQDIVAISCLHCTAKITKTYKIDAFQTTQGRAIPFATGMKLANSRLKIVVLGSNNDLFTIGGSHFMNAARRNIDMTVIWLNNLDYTTMDAQPSSDPSEDLGVSPPAIGSFIQPFNLPNLAGMAGAVYVARWTGFHFRRVTDSIIEAMNKPGFSVIEILVPYPDEIAGSLNDLDNKIDRLKLYYESSNIEHGLELKEVDLQTREDIIVGKFVDRDRPTYSESMAEHLRKKLGDKLQL